MKCNCHMKEKYESGNFIVNQSLQILERAHRNIIDRDKCYNGNGVSFEDYRINGLESCVEEVVENIVRLWNSKSDDKAEDGTAYMALMMAFIKEGMPQSRFSPIFNRLIPELYKGIKKDDERTGVIVDSQPYQPKAV